MNAVQDFAPDARRVFGLGDAPAVQIKYAPPSATERSELFDPDPADVVRHLCRVLDRAPDQWVSMPANARSHEAAQAWILTPSDAPADEPFAAHRNFTLYHPPAIGDRRLAIVSGMSATWIDVARRRLAASGWMPGRHREAVS